MGKKNPLFIVRQTVTDPLYNYGDTNSQSTSQPNDYARAGRNITYFKSLISNAFTQPGDQSGFVLLGLENSMELVYQEEYVLQLKWLNENLEKFNTRNVYPYEANIVDEFTKSEISVYSGENNNEKAWNITTPNYRLRLISKSGEAFISDVRFFDTRLKDPYTDTVAKYEAFWVVPFAVDGSRWYKPKKSIPSAPHYFLPPHNDFASMQNGLHLDIDLKDALTQVDGNEIRILTNKDGVVIFSKSEFSHSGRAEFEYLVPSKFPVIFQNPGTADYGFAKIQDSSSNDIYSMNIFCTKVCIYDFDKESDINKIQNIYETLYPYYLPEPVGRNLSITYSKITPLNRFAVSGRNPVRIILEPHDEFNFPIILHSDARITPDDKSVKIKTLGDLKKSQYQYVDFYSEVPLSSKINVNLGDSLPYFEKKFTIFFSPNCKEDFGYCFKHPVQGVWYIITKISDWWEGRK